MTTLPLFYDVFNGDADGICALHQLRLAAPQPTARLVTGVKRDIKLLEQLTEVRNATITVLDISLDSNREALTTLLANNCSVFYADHHFTGSIPEDPRLETHLDTGPEVCTSIIVDRLLGGKYRPWAVAAAFGDNLHETARQIAADISLPNSATEQLRELGELLNYNGYGFSASDLVLPPQELYKALRPYADPFEFIENSEELNRLRSSFQDDLARAGEFSPALQNQAGRVFELPAQPWARRVSGVFSNEKARQEPDLAHALVIQNQDGTYRISVRAPLNNKTGADTLCRQFPSGGGRKAAAGINALPQDRLADFLNSFTEIFRP